LQRGFAVLDSIARLRLRIGQVGAQERLTAEEEVRTPRCS
jgi:hypothetical protein